ncbi:hypothetical protein L249_6522 [Ophiocordyceps polyrhachis-furcata BCC 54312]|uniref:Uncharacterized protein n=1 Tax=Ophiocordyceps polyrhachis-furcata BCC 54312 TaxID=1330021 RepID=A0A367LLN4_9HYPO|nr:hypothetical protein L249_6522 [Ophiocordyceps polyrhachis-furcata BCC 54312]
MIYYYYLKRERKRDASLQRPPGCRVKSEVNEFSYSRPVGVSTQKMTEAHAKVFQSSTEAAVAVRRGNRPVPYQGLEPLPAGCTSFDGQTGFAG